jgi:hypothetical protein
MEFNIIKKVSRGKLVGKEEEICDMYFNQRKTLVEVAEAFGCDNKIIRVIFKNNNLKTRKTSESNIHKNIVGNEEKIVSMYQDGWSSYDLAEIYKVDVGALLNCLKRCGQPIRNTSEARTTAKVREKDKLRRIQFTEPDIKIMVDLYNEGYPASHICKLFEVDTATIKKNLIENGVDFRGIDKMYTHIVKEQVANTIKERFGGWKERNIYLNKKFQEKHGEGLTGAMQVPDMFYKQQKNGHKLKSITIDDIEIFYRGYELKAVYKLLEEGYIISDLNLSVGNPTINYIFEGKNKKYYPDIYIQKDNKIIEVKSLWTYTNNLNKNLAKERAVLNLGYDFEFYIMDKNGNRLERPSICDN